MSIEKFESIINREPKLFRNLIRYYGRSVLRRVLYAFENQQSPTAVASQYSITLDEALQINRVFQTAA